MKMLWTLLWKDLRRARHNPWPYILNLALPLCITGLIGVVFGPSSKSAGLGLIKVGVVDEDDSALGSLMRGAMNQDELRKRIEVQFLDRNEAMRQVEANNLSAVCIIPKGLTRSYLTGEAVTLELIKNPAQSFYPAIVEEFLAVVAAGLNGVSRNFQSEFPDLRAELERQGRPDLTQIAVLLVRVGAKFEAAEHYLFPPLAGYAREARQKGPTQPSTSNIFAFLLPGLAAMFLMFLADHAIRDLYREANARTLDRFRTICSHLLPFICSKVVLAMAVIMMGGAVIFGGGGWIFKIHWERPIPVAALTIAFGLFASGFMALLAALARTERRADSVNGVIIMLLSFIGGSLFPARQLPVFFRDYLSPLMPNYWFIEGMRALPGSGADSGWMWPASKLAILGILMIAVGTWIFERALSRGVKG